jgi:hypothetical protein
MGVSEHGVYIAQKDGHDKPVDLGMPYFLTNPYWTIVIDG